MSHLKQRSGEGLALSVAATAGRQYAGYVARQLRRAHRLIGPGGAALRELSVALVGDGRMRELNRRFTGRDQGTDVLAFGLDQDQRGRTICGEVVVCVSQAKRVARRVGIPVRRELLLYALHGLLHLIGMDDRRENDCVRMHRMEDRILTRLGVGAVFQAGAGKGTRRIGEQ